MHVLPIAGDDEQCVVDPDTKTEHDRNRGGEVGDGENVAEEPGQGRAEPDAGEGDPDGEAHGKDRPEGQDEDDDGEGDTEELRTGHLEFGEDLTTELDLEPFDLRHQLLELITDLPGLLERGITGNADLGVCDQAGFRALCRYLLRPFGGVGADQCDPLDLARLIEEIGHGRLDLRVGHPLLGAEDDGSPFATRRRPSEVLLEDVEALSALDVGQGELGAVGGADHGIGQDATEDQGGEPSQGNLAPVAKTPTSKLGEQNRLLGEGWRG